MAKKSATAPGKDPCRLYLITPPTFDPGAFADALGAALAGGDVACLQIRMKGASDDEVRSAARRLIPICHEKDVAVIINDRPDLAADVGADGVHVGQQDADYQSARTLLGDQAIVGVTCHNSRHLALEAAEAGADYVAFGAFFSTETKEVKYKAELETLTWWSDLVEVPCVAIGGITVENCSGLVAAGADFLAVIGSIWNHPDGPGRAVEKFNAAIAAVVARLGAT